MGEGKISKRKRGEHFHGKIPSEGEWEQQRFQRGRQDRSRDWRRN